MYLGTGNVSRLNECRIKKDLEVVLMGLPCHAKLREALKSSEGKKHLVLLVMGNEI